MIDGEARKAITDLGEMVETLTERVTALEDAATDPETGEAGSTEEPTYAELRERAKALASPVKGSSDELATAIAAEEQRRIDAGGTPTA
jgi:hypothetical protein